MPVLDQVLDEIADFPLEEQEMLLEILQKRIIEEKRELILKECKKGEQEYMDGKASSGSVADLMKEIDDD